MDTIFGFRLIYKRSSLPFCKINSLSALIEKGFSNFSKKSLVLLEHLTPVHREVALFFLFDLNNSVIHGLKNILIKGGGRRGVSNLTTLFPVSLHSEKRQSII